MLSLTIVVAWSDVPSGRHLRRAPLLTEAQVVALEKAKLDKEAHGEFESECPGYCVAQDTFYVGTLKGVGRVYQRRRSTRIPR